MAIEAYAFVFLMLVINVNDKFLISYLSIDDLKYCRYYNNRVLIDEHSFVQTSNNSSSFCK